MLKLIIVLTLAGLLSGCADTGNILADSAADTLGWATRGLSVQPAADEAVNQAGGTVAQQALQPLANAAAGEVDQGIQAAQP